MNEIRYYHHRLIKNNEVTSLGGVTAGWYKTNTSIVFAISVCRDDEQYNKRTGIQLVNSRLATPGTFHFEIPHHELIRLINSQLIPKFFNTPINFSIKSISNSAIIQIIKQFIFINIVEETNG